MYQRILVPVDGSDTSQRGLTEAIALAKLSGGSLRLLHVVDDLSFAMSADAMGGYVGDIFTLLNEGGQKILDQARSQVEAAGVKAEVVLRDRLAGAVDDLVIAEAQAWPADVIVIGTHGRRGASRMLLGSDAERILRLSPVPVLLTRGA